VKIVKILPIAAVPLIFAACAAQPPVGVTITPVGQSARAPADVAVCISKTWADRTQQPVTSQTVIAGNLAVDVLVPGQAPGGSAAMVRPAQTGGPGSWVGYRSVGSTMPPPADINTCL
jgi:hypothetical protein